MELGGSDHGHVWIAHEARDHELGVLERAVHAMSAGRLRGNCWCSLLVVPRGGGKTTMLRELERRAAHIGNDHRGHSNIICISLSVPEARHIRSLKTFILGRIREEFDRQEAKMTERRPFRHLEGDTWPMEQLNDALGGTIVAGRIEEAQYGILKAAITKLKERRELNDDERRLVDAASLKVLVLVDELDQLFVEQTSMEMYSDWMTTLHGIGNITGRRSIMAVVTGSAARLRSLVYRKARREDVSGEFPRYCASFTLNSGKYVVRCINTQVWTKGEFAAAMFILRHGRHPAPGEAMAAYEEKRHGMWSDMYETLGLLRNMQQRAVHAGATIPVRCAVHTDVYEAILALPPPGSAETRLEDPFEFNPENFRVDYVADTPVGDVPTSTLYDLHDRGAIIVDDSVMPWTVGIPSVSHLAYYLAHTTTISPYEAVCLTYPYSRNGTEAEYSVARSLAAYFHCDPPAYPMPRLCASQLVAFLVAQSAAEAGAGAGSGAAPEAIPDSQLPKLGKIYKEDPDVYGGDLVFIPSDGSRVVRVQVKLGESHVSIKPVAKDLRECRASALTDADLKHNAEQLCALNAHIRCVIVATVDVARDAVKKTKAHDVELLDRVAMYDLWAPDIQAWARRRKDARYADMGQSSSDVTLARSGVQVVIPSPAR